MSKEGLIAQHVALIETLVLESIELTRARERGSEEAIQAYTKRIEEVRSAMKMVLERLFLT